MSTKVLLTQYTVSREKRSQVCWKRLNSHAFLTWFPVLFKIKYHCWPIQQSRGEHEKKKNSPVDYLNEETGKSAQRWFKMPVIDIIIPSSGAVNAVTQIRSKSGDLDEEKCQGNKKNSKTGFQQEENYVRKATGWRSFPLFLGEKLFIWRLF